MARPQLNPLARPYFPPCQGKLTLLSVNCRSIVNKSAELSVIADFNKPDVICLNETWLNPSIALTISGYTTFRRDRPPHDNKSGTATRGYGGVAILVRQNRFGRVQVRDDLARPTCESVWVELHPILGSPTPILVCCTYRPPSVKTTEIDHFCDMLASALVTVPMSSYHVIMAGDFNSKHKRWCPSDLTCPAGAALFRTLTCFGLDQLVQSPTHTTSSGTQSCLDLVFTNQPLLATDVHTACALGSSDHLMVSCQFAVSLPLDPDLPLPSRKPFPYRFRRVPSQCWDSMNADFSCHDWSFLQPEGSPTVDAAVDHFAAVLERGFQQHLSNFAIGYNNRKHSNPTSSTSSPPWVTRSLVSEVKRKRDLFSIYKKFPTPVNREAYRVQRNFVKHLSRTSHRSFLNSLSATLSSPDRPSLHQFIRNQCRGTSRAPIQYLTDSNGNRQHDVKAIADTLNKQFVSSGIPEDPNWVIPSLSPAPELSAPLTRVVTTTATVCKHLKLLKNCKSPGEDGIPNEVLKWLAPSLSYPLCLLFNMSYRTGVFPSVWKSAVIVPIYKKGQRSQAGNYRPISLLPAVSKVCERIFFESLYCHVTPALSPSQSGFCRGDSTTFQLTRLVQDIYTQRNLRRHVDIVFFDLAKAFDTVWHRGLLAKLESVFLVHGPALQWLSSYLSCRHQTVRVSTSLSDPLLVVSGVPQGSILGPLLFLLYVNDLPALVPNVSLFADDTALMCSDSSADNLTASMQSGVNATVTWMETWKLKPNLAKTEAMFFSPSPPTQLLYFPGLNSTPIKVVNEHKHLGVILDRQLSWSPQVQSVCKRASASLGMLQPHCQHLNDNCRKLFFKSYILPIFDYCDIAWCGLSQTLLHRLEVHQRLLLKILFRKDQTFASLCLYKLASTHPLLARHQQHLCILVQKIFLAQVPKHIAKYNWFVTTRPTRNALSLPRASSSLFLKSPFFSAYSLWSNLPTSIKTCQDIRKFKVQLSTLSHPK